MFSACLWQSTLTVFRVALVQITFSMRKGENLVRVTPSKDSITMNLGKFAALFRLVSFSYLFEDAIYAVYFLLALHSATHHRVQLMLGIKQEGNPFTLIEMGICNHYIWVEGKFLNRCQFQVVSTGMIPILSTELTCSHHLLDSNR